MSMTGELWVYYVVLRNPRANTYSRFLLTAVDIMDAERQALWHGGVGERQYWSEMVCSTTDVPFFKEL